jgi:hypothetical protein
MNLGFRFTIGSLPEYEDLVGELYFDDCIVCVLTQEGGFETMQIEIYTPPSDGFWKFALKDFEEALAALKKRMWELRRTDSNET